MVVLIKTIKHGSRKKWLRTTENEDSFLDHRAYQVTWRPCSTTSTRTVILASRTLALGLSLNLHLRLVMIIFMYLVGKFGNPNGRLIISSRKACVSPQPPIPTQRLLRLAILLSGTIWIKAYALTYGRAARLMDKLFISGLVITMLLNCSIWMLKGTSAASWI